MRLRLRFLVALLVLLLGLGRRAVPPGPTNPGRCADIVVNLPFGLVADMGSNLALGLVADISFNGGRGLRLVADIGVVFRVGRRADIGVVLRVGVNDPPRIWLVGRFLRIVL